MLWKTRLCTLNTRKKDNGERNRRIKKSLAKQVGFVGTGYTAGDEEYLEGKIFKILNPHPSCPPTKPT